MKLHLKDFYTEDIKTFSPSKEKVDIYLCGPTVYDKAHIGNMRGPIVFDVLHRLLIHLGINVNLIHNITDIDDKIIERAIQTKKTEKDISEKYEKYYIEDLKKLNILNVKDYPKNQTTNFPRVSDHIEGMVSFISLLVDKGFAYEGEGSVYFSVEKIENYGKFINLNSEELKSKSVSKVKGKRNQLDFSLWKKTTKGIKFESPWGLGRPGWHTECAYFVDHFFKGKSAAIHGGGMDLRFPHHLNEMSQYQAIYSRPLAEMWFYVGHVSWDGTKISKSLGNHNLVNIEPYDLRLITCSSNPQKPINISLESIGNAKKIREKITNAITKTLVKLSFENILVNDIVKEKLEDKEFIEILSSNLDLANSYTHILSLIKKLNSPTTSKAQSLENLKKLLFCLDVLGFRISIETTGSNPENIKVQFK